MKKVADETEKHEGIAAIPPGMVLELPGVWLTRDPRECQHTDYLYTAVVNREKAACLVDVFLSQDAAVRHAQGRDREGKNAAVGSVKLVRTSGGGLHLLGKEIRPKSGKTQEELRKSALAKLTQEEIEALIVLGVTT